MTEQPSQSTSRSRLQHVVAGLWVVLLATVLIALAYPVGLGILRVFLVVAVPLLWCGAIVLTRRRRALAVGIAAAGVLVGGFAVLPGRTVDHDRLRCVYVNELRRCEGVRYVWGGENRFGIDCSGLVRRALIHAHVRLAVSTLNPTALRCALDLWWHDCTARALGEQYRGYTTERFHVPSANAAGEVGLLPGDIGVTADGVHVLAYVGDRKWIQADPGAGEVVILRAPHENRWMNQPLHIMRWSMLADPANNGVQATPNGTPAL